MASPNLSKIYITQEQAQTMLGLLGEVCDYGLCRMNNAAERKANAEMFRDIAVRVAEFLGTMGFDSESAMILESRAETNICPVCGKKTKSRNGCISCNAEMSV